MTNASETVRELCAEMDECKAISYSAGGCNDCKGFNCSDVRRFSERIIAAHEREIAAKDAEIETALKKQNDYHAALLTICTADKDAEGLREIAIDACNGKIAAHNRVAKAVRESEGKK